MRWRNLSALPSKPWGGRFMADSLLRFLDTEQIGRQLGQVILTGLLGQWAGKPQPPGDQFHAILVLVVTPVTGITVKRVADGLQVAADLVLARSEEHTSELQSRENLVCRLLLEKKKAQSE